MRRVSILFIVVVYALMMHSSAAFSQENKFGVNTMRLEARADFDYFNTEGNLTLPGSTSGFDGKYLNFELKGEFLEKFSYRYRQRLNIANSLGSKTFYQGTDWLALTYNATKNFSITTGKLCIGIGGWEYDLPPIDVYYASLFWENINCYDIGAQLNFMTNDQNHTISFQITNSPFAMGAFEGMYAYNLMWFGKMGIFRTSYSINMIEQRKGQYINYLPYLTKLLNKGGIIFADNLHFHGMVTGEIPITRGCRAMIKGLKRYIEEITTNDIYDTTIYDIGDGVGVTILKK